MLYINFVCIRHCCLENSIIYEIHCMILVYIVTLCKYVSTLVFYHISNFVGISIRNAINETSHNCMSPFKQQTC